MRCDLQSVGPVMRVWLLTIVILLAVPVMAFGLSGSFNVSCVGIEDGTFGKVRITWKNTSQDGTYDTFTVTTNENSYITPINTTERYIFADAQCVGGNVPVIWETSSSASVTIAHNDTFYPRTIQQCPEAGGDGDLFAFNLLMGLAGIICASLVMWGIIAAFVS